MTGPFTRHAVRSATRPPRAAARACGPPLLALALAVLASPLPAQEEAAAPPPPGEDLPVLPRAVDPPLPMPGAASDARPSLVRRPSSLERGWRLMGGAVAGRGAPSVGAVASAAEGGSGARDDPSFLVELLDARDVVAWFRDVKSWGLSARSTLFGPRGLVRAGRVPGSHRPRLRLQLTESRPGFQVVIITR